MARGIKRGKLKTSKSNSRLGTFFETPTWKIPGPKMMACKKCGHDTKVSWDTDAVTCWKCCAHMADPPQIGQQKRSGNPRGWKFMKVFVDKEGIVYHRGEEQKELKGTLPPTKIEVNKKPKLTKIEKATLKQDALVKFQALKKLMVEAKTKRRQKEIKREMKPLEKIIKKY